MVFLNIFANKPFGCEQIPPFPWTLKKTSPIQPVAFVHYDARKQWGQVYLLPQNFKCFQHPFWNPHKKY
jgi:hypothetical protein